MSLDKSISSALENIYISPLDICNLNCRYCYIKKTKTTLSSKQILDFIDRYQTFLNKFRSQQFFGAEYPEHSEGPRAPQKFVGKKLSLKSITFCGGEVFLLPWFTNLVNTLLDQNIFISIITNGTIDKLVEIKDPSNCQLLVSFDGPREIHDQNRGKGNFDKSVAFVKKALSIGFPIEIFFLITKDSYPYKNSFDLFNLPKTYLTDRLHSLTPSQILDIKKNYPTYPRRNFGCFQLALQSDGQIYGCCESPAPLAKITDPISTVIKNFTNSLAPCQKCKLHHKEENNFSAKICLPPNKCLGCCSPDFFCGYKKELNLPSCQKVVELFNS